ncbi:hypothetical protein QJS04_geneDACA019350 [Acorus gramineus]|uniref:KIB1-4 beta-propeller domain-containing protein n=1 Tax=Acorus gramineus TaxID=55184 RepID=A0AAV9ASB5_ACOGR|nr:hypothetical protein QJS04_geneDACA019350 [Acorus gramineus]
MKAPNNYLFFFFLGIFHLTMCLCGMFMKLRGRKGDEQGKLKRSDHSSVLTKSNQPLQDRKESSINEDITPVSHLSPINVEGIRDEQRKLERSDHSSMVTKSQHQQLQDKKESVINEDITPVSHVSPIDIEVSNVVENPGADGGVLQDASLPDLVLLFILKHFTSFGDFFAFSLVCREWRHVSEFAKREYMATQPPLLFENRDGFYSWKEEKLYTKEIKSVFKIESIIDFSHGYLILLCSASYYQVPYKRFFSLVNPITGVEALPDFPILPNYIGSRYVRVKCASLMSPPTSPDCMLMFSNDTFILLCHSGDREWTVYPRDDEDGKILCETFFNGRVYALNDKGHLLILDPAFHHHHLKRTVLEVENNPFSHRNMTWLADCGGDLFAIELINKVKFVVRRFDPMKCKWVKWKNWGNSHILFLNSRRSAFWDNAVNWGGCGNCIYFHGFLRYRGLFVFDMKDGKIKDLPLSLRYYNRSFWVFPRLCC